MAIAEKLGKFAWEVEEHMTLCELYRWVAWSKFTDEQEKKAMRKASNKSSAPRRPKPSTKRSTGRGR